MLGWLTLGILALLAVSWRFGGVLRALCIAWLVCLVPAASGIVYYDNLSLSSDNYLRLIAGSVVAFVVGTVAARVVGGRRSAPSNSHYDWDSDFERWWPLARVAIAISILAVFSMFANAFVLGGQLLNLAALRSQVIQAESANIFARLGAVTIWACFFCYCFALYFRHLLTPMQLLTLSAAAIGIFLSALTTAGRQAPLQLVLLTLFVEAFRSQRLPKGTARGFVLKFVALGLSAALILYVTVNRSTVVVENKSTVFLRIFQAHLGNGTQSIFDLFGNGVQDVATEALLYISHPVSLFAISSNVDYGGPYFGAMDFPFILRQLQPITGINVQQVLDLKIFTLSSERVIGVGWDTALSGLIMDFTVPGMLLAMALFGFAGQRVMAKVRRAAGFPMVVVAAVLIMVAAYMPYFSALSDTNILFLLITCALMAKFGPTDRARQVEPVVALGQFPPRDGGKGAKI